MNFYESTGYIVLISSIFGLFLFIKSRIQERKNNKK